MDELLHPRHLYSRAEVLTPPSPVPRSPGVYAWYFQQAPPDVPVEGCHRCGNLALLYVGIASARPPANGARPSRQTLRDRIRQHLRGNASGSTLRLTVGVLLGLPLERTGSTGRLTFGAAEEQLSAWLGENARVTWAVTEAPWQIEERLIRMLSLPLNLRDNDRHPFAPVLRARRREARERARRRR